MKIDNKIIDIENLDNEYTFNLEGEHIIEVKLNDSTVLPEPREDATMIYYQHSKNLLLFGGTIRKQVASPLEPIPMRRLTK